MAQQAHALLTDGQYKDLIVFQAHQHLEAVKMAAQHAQQAIQATQAAEQLGQQLKEAAEKAEGVRAAFEELKGSAAAYKAAVDANFAVALPTSNEPAAGGVEVLTDTPEA